MMRALFLEHLARGGAGRDGPFAQNILVHEPDRMACRRVWPHAQTQYPDEPQ